jgi:hypothetical protein
MTAHEKIFLAAALVLGLAGMARASSATIIFEEGGEAYADEQDLPNPNFCAVECGAAESAVGKAEDAASCDPSAGAPVGDRCLKWTVAQDQQDMYNEIGKFGSVVTEGSTLFLAFRQNINRIGEVDVWAEGAGTQSADKGLGLHGEDISDFRWDLSMGQWDSMAANQDHAFTVWVGNPSNHFNAELELDDIYVQNVAPYGADSPIQLGYDRWYNFVLEVRLADASPEDGYVRAYVNGVKILEYTNIQTTDTFSGGNIVFDWIEFGGTLCQPAYNCPEHTRYFDDLMVATEASEVSSYMSDPESGGGDEGLEPVDLPPDVPDAADEAPESFPDAADAAEDQTVADGTDAPPEIPQDGGQDVPPGDGSSGSCGCTLTR